METSSYKLLFQEKHSDVRLGCPKCPQTYHSPELLNVHYKHFHLKDLETDENIEAAPNSIVGGGGGGAGGTCSQLENGRTTLRNGE